MFDKLGCSTTIKSDNTPKIKRRAKERERELTCVIQPIEHACNNYKIKINNNNTNNNNSYKVRINSSSDPLQYSPSSE